MKQWWVKEIPVKDLRDSAKEIVEFTNQNNLLPGEIVSLGHHVGFTGVPYSWTIMYYAEKELI